MAMHRGLTADQRREQRRRLLIDAALDTIAEQGVSNLRVRAISERARLNDRYFYESFPDCQALVLATFEDQFDRALAGVMDILSDSPPNLELRTRTIIEFTFRFIDEDPRRPRLLIELQSAEALAERRREVIGVLTQVVVAQMGELLGEAAGTDENTSLTALTIIAGLLELTSQWYRQQIDVSQSRLVEFITAFVVTTSDITGALERQLEPPGSGG